MYGLCFFVLLKSVIPLYVSAQFNQFPQWEPQFANGRSERAVQDDNNYFYNPRRCPPDPTWPCYDNIQIRNIPDIGKVIGRSMIFHEYGYINTFMGIPYAKPPVGRLRFKPPEDPGPGWDQGIRNWDATYYRPACPQDIWKLNEKFHEVRNTSEDCLYLNIFSPNLTDRVPSRNKDYPVVVFIHGEDFTFGDSQLYPGHILAKKEVVVVTFNYRLGALGFMSTLDSNSPGNYGLHDVLKVLDFVRKNIRNFRGDPNKVTLIGSGSGASMVGLLLVSPLSLNGSIKLFHKAIMMSGADLCESALVEPILNKTALEYTKELGRHVGCDPDYGSMPIPQMVECLRYKHFEEIINATAAVWKRYGSLAGPFGPVVDGFLLPKTPKEMREDGNFMKIPIMAGVTRDEGAYFAENITKDIIGLKMSEGMDPGTFREILYKMIRERATIRNIHEVVGALEFEYTFWAKPDNRTAVAQNLVDLWSDMAYGWCMDAALKYHAQFDETVYMYIFDYRSEYERLPLWMGVPHGKDVDFLFGHPFLNDTYGNFSGIIPDQWEWTWLDRNISVFVQDMWMNFAKYGDPTTEWTGNVTWYPFSLLNLSFLSIQEFSFMDSNYRQNRYAFWREYFHFPTVSSKWPITTTPQPIETSIQYNTTPRPLEENNTTPRPLEENNTTSRPSEENNTTPHPLEENITTPHPLEENSVETWSISGAVLKEQSLQFITFELVTLFTLFVF